MDKHQISTVAAFALPFSRLVLDLGHLQHVPLHGTFRSCVRYFLAFENF